MWHVCGRRAAYKALMGRPHGKMPFGRPRHKGRIILKWVFKKFNEEPWTGLICLRKGTGGGIL
jgi:hypothetical protein